MAYTAPTHEDFKARFPAFAVVNDKVVIDALVLAGAMVDDEWISQADFTDGSMLLAAHYLTLDGHGSGAEGELASKGLMGFSSIQSGQLSLTRGSAAADAAPGSLKSTSYGQRFLAILRRNRPAVLTV